jgi:hypothetical protein
MMTDNEIRKEYEELFNRMDLFSLLIDYYNPERLRSEGWEFVTGLGWVREILPDFSLEIEPRTLLALPSPCKD